MSVFLKSEDWLSKTSSLSILNVSQIHRLEYLGCLIILFAIPLLTYFDIIEFYDGTGSYYPGDVYVSLAGSIQAFLFIIVLPVIMIKRLRGVADKVIEVPAFNFLSLRALKLGPFKIKLRPNLNTLTLVTLIYLGTFLYNFFDSYVTHGRFYFDDIIQFLSGFVYEIDDLKWFYNSIYVETTVYADFYDFLSLDSLIRCSKNVFYIFFIYLLVCPDKKNKE